MQLTTADKLRTSNDQYSNRNYSQNVPVTVTNEKPFVQSELDGWHLHVHVVFEEHRSYPHNDIRYYGTTLVYRYFVRLSCLFLVWLNIQKSTNGKNGLLRDFPSAESTCTLHAIYMYLQNVKMTIWSYCTCMKTTD